MARPRKATEALETVGAFDKNPDRRADRTGEPIPPSEAPKKPRFLKGRAKRLWEEYAPICCSMGTLKRGDESEFSTWCCLQAEYEKGPEAMTASRIAQKRAYAERFGMAGAGARAKLNVSDHQPQDPADKYFSEPGIRPGTALRQ